MGKAVDRLTHATLLQKLARAAWPLAPQGSGCARASGACWSLTVTLISKEARAKLLPPSSPDAPRGDSPSFQVHSTPATSPSPSPVWPPPGTVPWPHPPAPGKAPCV